MDNRRAHKRYEAEVAAEIEIDGDVLVGETRDVSTGGAKVELRDALEEGSSVALTLILTEDGIEDPNEDPFEAEATVMWAAPTDAGGAMVGLRFGNMAGEQSARLTRFLDALSRA